MATEQFMPQYVNWNNLEEVWAQIVHNFIAAAPAAKGDMIYWSGVPTAGVNANPAASVAHLSVPAQADQSKSLLGVANGIPAWRVLALGKTEATSKLTIGISLGGASVSSVDILEATASRAGVITTLEQTIKGDKHLQGNFDATGGVAAKGITDLSQASGGGGGGTVANVDFTQDVPYQQTGVYSPDDGTIHLPRYKWGNIQDKPIVTTGSTNGTISYGGVDVAVYGLQALAYKASLSASDIPTIAISQVSGLQTALNNKLETSLKGATNGLAELDERQKIKLSQIPDVVLGQLVFGGTVNASGVATLSANAKTKTGITSNTVTLSNSAGTSSSYGWVRFEGCFFIMDADSDFGNLGLKVGDWLLSTGTAWKKVDNTDAVTGVKGSAESSYRIGNVNITKANIGLGNVENTALSTWAGTQNITTLGTITTGVWHGTKIANDYLANKTIYINGTSFTLGDSATDNKLTEKWGKSRNIKIASSDGSNESAVVSVDGSAAVTLKLASTIKASLDGNASSATKLQNSRNIWGQAFDGTAEVSGNMSSVGNIAFNAGNHNIGSLLYFDMTNGRIGIGTSTPQDKLGVQGDMSATGGVAAYGISDLSQSGGGGGGLSGTILRDWSQYDGSAEANQILSSYLGIEQFRMNGQKMQFMRNKTWVDGFTLAEGNIPDLAIGKITGVQSLTIKGGTTSIGTYSPSSALEFSIVAGTNISVTPDATNHKITIANTYSYTLPTASSSTKGGVKVGSGLTISNEVLSVSGVTNDMLSGSIANGKLASLGKFTIDSQAIELGQTYTQANFRSYLGLGTAATHAHGDYVTDLGISGKTLTWAKGGAAQDAITIPYAKESTTLETESLEGQEFIFRNSPKTIGADSLKLDRILGRTVVWNQMTINDLVYSSLFTGSKSGNRYNLVTKSMSAYSRMMLSNTPAIVGHKYYIGTYVYTNQLSNTFRINSNPTNYGSGALVIAQGFTGYQHKIVEKTMSDIESNNWNIMNSNAAQASGASFEFSSPIIIDLTLFFNGNIPTGLTAETFERDYGYLFVNHTYDPGQLINNSAEGLETVGFNLWDEKITNSANVDINTGNIYASSNNSCSTNLTPIIPSTAYCLSTNLSSKSCNIYFYDANKNILSQTGWDSFTSGVKTFTTPTNAYYVRFTINSATLAIGEACLNLSDTAKNGTYEPHKLSVLNLHLKNLQVKSPNIWDEEWESGTLRYQDGEKSNSSVQIVTKNFVPVIPGATYYLKNPYSSGDFNRMAFYDANKIYLGANTTGWTDANERAITVPTKAYYCRFTITTPSYNNDICFNLSDPGFNGKYFPHGVLTFNGLKQAGDVRDEIVGGKYIRRVGSVDLGTLTYSASNSVFTAAIPTMRSWSSQTPLGSGLTSAKYLGTSASLWSSMNNMEMGASNSATFRIKDTAYTDAAAFKTAMSGVMLNYELATYETYDLISPIPTAMPAGTTERRLPEDTADSVIAPFCADIAYGTNPGDILTDMIGLDKKLDFNLSRMNIAHYKSSQDGVIDSHLITLREGQQMYFKFNASTQGKFELAMASDGDDTNLQEFSFGTMTAAQIQAICHL